MSIIPVACIHSTRENEGREGEVAISKELEAWIFMKNDGILDRVAIQLLLLHASKLTDVVDQNQAKQAKRSVMAKRVFASEQR